MPTITVIDNQHVTLYYHQEEKIIHHIYRPTIGGRFLKDELNAGIDLIKSHGAKKWLSDNRAIESHSPQETEWINADWLPRAIEAGWKYWALVVPQSVRARLNMSEFVQSFYEMGVRIMVFTDPDEAMDWLIKIS